MRKGEAAVIAYFRMGQPRGLTYRRRQTAAPVPLEQFSLERDGLARLSDADLHRWTTKWRTGSRLRLLGDAEARRRENVDEGTSYGMRRVPWSLWLGSAGLVAAVAALLA